MVWFPVWDGIRASSPNRKLFVWFGFLFGMECALPVLTGNRLFGVVWFPGWDGMCASGPNRKLFGLVWFPVWDGMCVSGPNKKLFVWFGFLFGTEGVLPSGPKRKLFDLFCLLAENVRYGLV